jgi:hypothetical protein
VPVVIRDHEASLALKSMGMPLAPGVSEQLRWTR